ncbi:COMM domain-containing protein 7 [Cynoglossus semilaevis]|uniref:COMM domain containing 7 n=1 Tax=Cynoglossus semilaevis TaxID=244447 RepID=A0A3P8VHN3_CYNSE|nr:COMM domain-containing protein 7 [Cynoglossus semilaevis]
MITRKTGPSQQKRAEQLSPRGSSTPQNTVNMQLHFTKEVLPDSVSADFQNLNKFNEQQFHRLIEILFQFLLEPKEAERFMQQLTEFAGEHGMSAGPLKNLMKSVLLVPQGALKKILSAEQVKEDLTTLGLNEDKATYFSQQWGEHFAALSRLAVAQTLMVNQLVDMEWKFGVTVGTSEIQRVGNVFLQLKLVVRQGNCTENVYMELTLPQFYNFLHEMERAKASMESFS